MNNQVEALNFSQYPQLKEVVEKARISEPLTYNIPAIGKPYDNVAILRCGKTIDKGVYLVVLEDLTMFYAVDDL